MHRHTHRRRTVGLKIYICNYSIWICVGFDLKGETKCTQRDVNPRIRFLPQILNYCCTFLFFIVLFVVSFSFCSFVHSPYLLLCLPSFILTPTSPCPALLCLLLLLQHLSFHPFFLIVLSKTRPFLSCFSFPSSLLSPLSSFLPHPPPA